LTKQSPLLEGRKEGREGGRKEGKEGGRKEGRKEGRREGGRREEGRKEGGREEGREGEKVTKALSSPCSGNALRAGLLNCVGHREGGCLGYTEKRVIV
jgi:hypothetical protein